MDRREFLESRRQGIGGSDVAAIIGISKWMTPLDVYNSKVKPITEQEEVSSDAIHFGNVLEQVVAEEFQRRTGLKPVRRNKAIRHKQYPYLIANVDRYLLGEKAFLECKTASSYASGEWGEEGTDRIPMPYLCQVMHYQNVTGWRNNYVAVLIGGQDYRIYKVPFNHNLARTLQKKCVQFWNEHVLPRVPPDPVNLDDVAKLYADGGLDPIEGTEEVLESLQNYIKSKEDIRELEDEMNTYKFNIQRFMKNHNTLLDHHGDIVATWKKNKRDQRVFLIKKKKEA